MQFTDNILLAGQIAAAISAIGGLVYIIVIYAVVKPIKVYIDLATYQIQPTSNGGSSLPDAIKAIKRVEQKIEKLSKRIDIVETHLTDPS
jgi:hypothetical protein